ncbi:hypothetical protein Btru_055547 [Bulinus truncatus]|nr:hypothetical protein Btru_055547 [Bulinus truncatus]
MRYRHSIYYLPFLLTSLLAADDFQAWSERSYLDTDHELTCNDTTGQIFISYDYNLRWSRQGYPGYLESNEKYQLNPLNGIANMTLLVRNVTGSEAGIYFCNAYNSSGQLVGRVVKGLNIAGPLYNDYSPEYKWNIIVGFISAGCVMFLIVGVGLLENFRYLSVEQKQKKKDRKAARSKGFGAGNHHQMNGVDNMVDLDDISTRSDKKKESGNGIHPSTYDLGNTHL